MNGTPNPYPTLDGAFFKELFRDKKSIPETQPASAQVQSTYEPSIAQSDSATLVGTEENVLRHPIPQEKLSIGLISF
jgi:hypothetical protein